MSFPFSGIPHILEGILIHLDPRDIKNIRLVNKESKEVVDHILQAQTTTCIDRAVTPELYRYLVTQWNVREVTSDKVEPDLIDPELRVSHTSPQRDYDSDFSSLFASCDCYKWIGVMDQTIHRFGLGTRQDVEQVSSSHDCELAFFKMPQENGDHVLYASRKDKILLTLPHNKKYEVLRGSDANPKYVLLLEGDVPWWEATVPTTFNLLVVNLTRSDEARITKTIEIVFSWDLEYPGRYVDNFQNKLLFTYDKSAGRGKIFLLEDREEEHEGPVREFEGLDNNIVKTFDVFYSLRTHPSDFGSEWQTESDFAEWDLSSENSSTDSSTEHTSTDPSTEYPSTGWNTENTSTDSSALNTNSESSTPSSDTVESDHNPEGGNNPETDFSS